MFDPVGRFKPIRVVIPLARTMTPTNRKLKGTDGFVEPF